MTASEEITAREVISQYDADAAAKALEEINRPLGAARNWDRQLAYRSAHKVCVMEKNS